MIRYYDDRKIFKIDTRNTSYVFEVLYDRYLIHLYYGERIEDYDLDYLRDDNPRSASVWDSDIGVCFSLDQSMQEYPFFGTGNFGISSIKVKNSNGDCNSKLVYKDYKISEGRSALNGLPFARCNNTTELEISLYDNLTNLEVILYYDCYYDFDMITRHVKIINNGNDCEILKAFSMNVDLECNDMDILTLPGNYALERIENRSNLTYGIHTVSSIRGMTGHDKNPFAIVMDKATTNDFGNAYGFNLIYSGDFKLEVEKNQYSNIRVSMGINDDTFSWHLNHGEEFTSPEGIMTFTTNGINGITSNMHKFIRKNILPTRFMGKAKPIIVNTWEGSCFQINSQKVKCYANYASKIGADMVVLDDGWFARRNDDTDGLGDWYVNEEKFPNGLNDVIAYLDKLNLDFGIWVEPEMVNPKSDLYKAHPEWVLGSLGRELMYSRSQYVLDLSNPSVIEYIKGSLDSILGKYKIKYIKWDMNRPLSDVSSRYTKNSKEISHRYVLGLYELLSYLNIKYPNLLIESCAGGGGRFDLGILSYSPYIWTSDNTSPYERALIQDGTSIAYPLECMSNHVTTGLNGGTQVETTLNFRYQIAKLGALGYELDFKKLNDNEIDEIKNQIIEYRSNSELILNSTLYRLLSPKDSRYYSVILVSNDKSMALLSVNQLKGLCNQKDLIVKLKGLDDNKYYSNNLTKSILSGRCLKACGFKIPRLCGNGCGVSIVFKEVK